MPMTPVRTRLAAVLLAGVAGGLAACAGTATNAAPADTPSSAASSVQGIQRNLQMTSPELPPRASRRAPRRLEPVVHAGVRYEQVIGKALPDQDESGRYLAAYDMASNQLLWGVKVYDTPQNAELERDVQAVFFASMQLDDSGKSLLVANERGRRFAIDLATHTVRELPAEPAR
jgi:hypothetical protein